MTSARPILLAADLSPDNEPALAAAGRLARTLAVPLHLVHVEADPDWGANLREADPRAMAAVEAERSQTAERLRARVERLRADGIDAGSSIERGTPSRCLAERAEALGAQLLVTGAGGGGEELGAVAERVVRRSPCPVLVVRGSSRPPADGAQGLAVPPARVLVPVDFSPPSLAAVETVLDLLRRLGGATRVRLLFAVSPFQGAVGTVEVDYDSALAVAREAMERLVATHRQHFGDRLETTVRRGFPRPEIRAEAADWRPDLVALGTHGRGGTERLMLGSVAEDVVRHAPSSVLVVPPPDDPAAS